MAPIISLLLLLLLVTCLSAEPLTESRARSVTAPRSPPRHSSRITVVGAVYCDTCSSNAFTKHSYFLPGVDVQIRCKFRANSRKTAEEVNYSVTRTTDRHGVYRLEVPTVDGANCVNGLSMVSMCQATLVGTSSSVCAVPFQRTASNEISIKSEQDNLCIYSLNALSYTPSTKNRSLCGNKEEEMADALESSKCFFPWPNLPPIFHLPPLSSLPWPFQFPPNLPFPFPSLPPLPPATTLFAPPPPPPPAFSFWDPRTWIPYSPPSPHEISHNQNP